MINLHKRQSGDYLPTPSPNSKINKYLGGLHKKFYILIGADSGVGKTTFADYMFLYHYKDTEILYYSLELGKEVKFAQWVTILIKESLGIDIPPMNILGIYKLLSNEEKETVSRFLEVAKDKFSKIEIKEYLEDSKQLREDVSKKLQSSKNLVVFIDHIALAGEGDKKTIDSISKEIVKLRNNYEVGAVVIQQFNTELGSTYRDSLSEKELIPSRLDFGDSRYTYRDADLVFGGVNPGQHHFKKYAGYDISILQKKASFWYLIKDRYFGSHFKISMYRDSFTPILKNLPSIKEEEKLNTIYANCNSRK